MKRIIPLLIAVMLLCACAGRADIQPLVRTDGHAEAYVREGILHVRCEEGRYAAAVTVNGERVWLCDGQYAHRRMRSANAGACSYGGISESDFQAGGGFHCAFPL